MNPFWNVSFSIDVITAVVTLLIMLAVGFASGYTVREMMERDSSGPEK